MVASAIQKPIAPERSGWRDERISRRHRERYGFDCPGVDIDFLLVEYDTGRPCAIVDYKHEQVDSLNVNHPNMRALACLGDMAGLPAFACGYADDFSWYWPVPLNDEARRACPHAGRMTEKEWVSTLYRIRGRSLPDHLQLQDGTPTSCGRSSQSPRSRDIVLPHRAGDGT